MSDNRRAGDRSGQLIKVQRLARVQAEFKHPCRKNNAYASMFLRILT